MYTKLVQKPAIREARELLANGEALLVFKHSNSCPVSFTAKRQYDQFLAANPDVPTRLVVVQQERALSNALETVRRSEPVNDFETPCGWGLLSDVG